LKVFNTILGLVFGLALLMALLAGGYLLVRYVVDLPGTLDPPMVTIIAIASVVALLCTTIIASSLKSRDHREHETGTRVERAYIYKQLLSMSNPWDKQKGEGNSDTNSERFRLKQRLAVWGSPGVITAYAKLERRTGQEGPQDDGVQLLLSQLIMEMRKDLGQSTSGLTEGDILDLLQNGVPETEKVSGRLETANPAEIYR
jgi:hypothetical protein